MTSIIKFSLDDHLPTLPCLWGVANTPAVKTQSSLSLKDGKW